MDKVTRKEIGMDINQKITEELGVKKWQVDAAVTLIDEGNTIPFIARYRKEATGTLDDEQLRKLYERLTYLRNLEEKKEQVLASIEEQGNLTEELKHQILSAETLVVVEDMYRPYRPKRRTRATIAKEKGLEPLAALIMLQSAREPLEELAKAYISEEKEVTSAQDALDGAKDIIAESISDEAKYRIWIRQITMKKGKIVSSAKDEKAESVYEMYYEFEEPAEKLAGHRILALNRGEKEKFLTVKVQAPEEEILRYLEKKVIRKDNPYTTPVLKEVVADSYQRLIAPAIERELRNELTEKAEKQAISVFAANLRQLLLQQPIAGHTVLGLDPGYRTGCKAAVIDPNGRTLAINTLYITGSQHQREQAEAGFMDLVTRHKVTLVAIGNGTASFETEEFTAQMIEKYHLDIAYLIVSEAGASVYSASKLAREELPDLDVSLRGAVSIARRVQDPLAELVKIEPKAIGVGQYQHDVNQKELTATLGTVVESCVNHVGVELNTASPALLSYVAGISGTVAKNIIAYRGDNGAFTSRKELLKVARLGPAAFTQCAGFLRIAQAKNPLDNTSVHPESYKAAAQLLKHMGYTEQDVQDGTVADLKQRLSKENTHKLAEELGIGEITLKDIADSIIKKGRDPREELPQPVLRSDILSMEDLKPDMVLTGTVRNVIDFGAFVDIGVHQDGLVHISQICDRYIKHPTDVLSVGDVVKVRVLEVDVPKKRISLTMKEV